MEEDLDIVFSLPVLVTWIATNVIIAWIREERLLTDESLVSCIFSFGYLFDPNMFSGFL